MYIDAMAIAESLNYCVMGKGIPLEHDPFVASTTMMLGHRRVCRMLLDALMFRKYISFDTLRVRGNEFYSGGALGALTSGRNV